MTKVTKVLFIIALFLLIFYLFARGYVNETESIADRVGYRIGGGELSISDYYTLAQCIETYNDYLVKSDYETAYKMINGAYSTYTPFEKYKELVSRRDNSKMAISSIVRVTPTTYQVTTDVSGEKVEYSIILNENNESFSLLPESFLDYKEIEVEESKKRISCKLNDYVVKIDESIFNFDIKNNNGKNAKIVKASLETNTGSTINKNLDISLDGKSTIPTSILFNTDYAFPLKVVLNIEYEGKAFELVFKLN